MGITQIHRGNPEAKSIYLTANFVGGVNVTYSDDSVEDTEFRQLLNYNIDNRGSLDKRKGYSKVTALTELIGHGLSDMTYFPVFANNEAEATCKEIYVFKLLENGGNAWNIMGEFNTLADYQLSYGKENNTIKFLMISKSTDDKYYYTINKYTISSEEVTTDHKVGELPMTSKMGKLLSSMNIVEQFKKLYITCADQGMLIFDDATDEFTYCGDFEEKENSAYKPNAIEIRKIGFNVLGDSPLTWVGDASITTESIRGMYLTTKDNIPIQIIPDGQDFRINILITGSKTDFTVTFKEEDNEISADIVKNTELSAGNLVVYDVKLKAKPNRELEISIKHSDTAVTLKPYIDYYDLGTVDINAKPIEKLNVGGFQVLEMGQRMVFYKGDTIWFSEITRYDYIPNYNYVILPIEATDYITKIIFFRTNYIVFTSKRIYKLMGSFGMEDFQVKLVNDDIGCDQPHTVRSVNDELIFLSPNGMRNLKLDVFRENLENVKHLDDKVRPLIPIKGNGYAFVYRDEYIVYYNNPSKPKTVQIAYKDYINPDVCRYYLNMKAFVFDKFNEEKGAYPKFIIPESGNLYALQKVKGVITVHKYGQDYDDFGVEFETTLETCGVNLGYALHTKKVKDIILKVGGGELPQDLFAEVYADGAKLHSTITGAVVVNDDGSITYEEINAPNVQIDGTTSRFDNILLGLSKFGYNPNIIRKLKLPVKAKNVSILIRSTNGERLSIQAIGYTFKLGKVKE